jgi:hypothetical protein
VAHAGDMKLRIQDKMVEVRAILTTNALILCQVKDDKLLVRVSMPLWSGVRCVGGGARAWVAGLGGVP